MKSLGSSFVQKLRLLIIGAILFFILAYLVAIRGTVTLASENQKIKRQLELVKEAPQQIENLNLELSSLQSSLTYVSEGDGLRRELLELIGELGYKHQILFKNFKEPSHFFNENFLVETHEIALQGPFKNLVKAIFELEKELKTGKVASVNFVLEIDRREKRKFLVAYVFIQSIKK
jgi:hypothetical protein